MTLMQVKMHTTFKEVLIMINTTLQRQFEAEKPLTKCNIKVDVCVNESEMVDTLASKIHSELFRMAPYAGYADVAELEVEDIRRYLNTLMFLRTSHVNSENNKGLLPYKPMTKYYAIPVLWYQVLISVGIAWDKEFNLEFRPAYTLSQDDILSAEEMEALSDLFRSFEDKGFKLVYGLPREREGELEFMAMSHVTDEVISYKKSHPVYGFLASFCRQQELNVITGTMSRVVYGYSSDYKHRLDAIFDCIDGRAD